MGVDKSNEWSVSYFTTFSVDTFMFESMGNFVKIAMLRKEIILDKKSLMHKLFGNDDIINYIKNNN